MPVVLTAPFRFSSSDELAVAFAGGPGPGQYSRYENPTVRSVEVKLAALEGAADAVAFASGMAAVAATVEALLPAAGGRVLAARELYGGTDAFFTWASTHRRGVELVQVALNALPAALAAMATPPNLVYLESPTNPQLRIIDLVALAAACRARGSALVVDNTFATPILQNPLEHGATAVLHSATKFLGGHSDLTAGVVATAHATLAATIRDLRSLTGACLDPHAAYLLGRGMKTLALRIERQASTAANLASWLADHPRVEAMHYPAWETLPAGQMRGGGAMLSLVLRGGDRAAASMVDRLRLFAILPSLGGVESGVSIPAITSHRGLGSAARSALGIAPGMVRLSVGIEALADLRADLAQALAEPA